MFSRAFHVLALMVVVVVGAISSGVLRSQVATKTTLAPADPAPHVATTPIVAEDARRRVLRPKKGKGGSMKSGKGSAKEAKCTPVPAPTLTVESKGKGKGGRGLKTQRDMKASMKMMGKSDATLSPVRTRCSFFCFDP